VDRVNRVEVHIDELVLHGFSASDRDRISETLAVELGRLLSERGSPWRAASREEFRPSDIHVPTHYRAEDVGSQLAKAIHGGLENE
jgi:hypothetical protein